VLKVQKSWRNSEIELHSHSRNYYGNQIGDEGAKVIGESLKLNSTLTKLNLKSNEIGYEGAKVIFESLSLNSTLTQLDLYYEQFGDELDNISSLLKRNIEKKKN